MLERDPEGLSVICVAGMPHWFNSFLDRYQRLALARLVADIDLRDARILDIGTGIGRWANWYAERGTREVVGVDLEPRRLRVAHERITNRNTSFEQMAVERLAFASASFDLVNSITVLQHVDRPAKQAAIEEIARVLRPGGHAVLFELTDLKDDAPHVFPESREDWLDLCGRHSLRPVRMLGEQYTPLLRLARGCARLISRSHSRQRIDGLKRHAVGRGMLSPTLLMLRFLVALSYPLEEVCQRSLPASTAKITGFLFRKEGTTA